MVHDRNNKDKEVNMKLKVLLRSITLALTIAAATTSGSISYAAPAAGETLEKSYDGYEGWWLFDGKIPDEIASKYTPDQKTKSLLDQAEKKGIDESFVRFKADAETDGTYYQQIAETKSFKLFYVGPDNKMILKTESGDYLFLDSAAYSVHEVGPMCTEYDLDEDGENELAMNMHLLHGTGYSEDLMYIADTDNKGDWHVYIVNPMVYMPEIAKHAEAKVSGDEATLYVDGKKEGDAVKLENYKTDVEDYLKDRLYLESFVEIDIYDGKLWVGSRPVFNQMYCYGPEMVVWQSFSYEGAGKMTPEDVVTRISAYHLYHESDLFSPGDLYYDWVNPNFVQPLIITADKKDIIGDKEKSYNVKTMSCKVSVLKNGKLETIGEINGGSDKYPITISPDGIWVADEHSMYLYEPDPSLKKLIIKDGAEDNTISKFSSHKGFIRIRNDKAENITKNEFEAVYGRYADTTPLLF
jgi:hypothetical protein